MFLIIMIWAFISTILWFALDDAPIAFKAWGVTVVAFWIGVGYIVIHFVTKFW